MIRKPLAFLLAAGIAVSVGGIARAQDPSPEDMKARLERLERMNQELLQRDQELLQRVQSLQTTPTSPAIGAPQPASPAAPPTQALNKDEVVKIIGEYKRNEEQQKKLEDAAAKQKVEDEGYKVGTNLNMTASWQNGFVASTPNKDFTMHLGGWVQYDNVFYNQSAGLQTPAGARPGAKQGVASGAALGGIGDLEDGTYFRRIRLQTDGTFFETYEYILTLAFENEQVSTIGLDEFWVGAKNIPIIGTARLGHVKNAIGFEGDMSGSSKVMTFMERSSYSEAIELNQNFVTGLWLGNNYFDERTTWSFVAFRPDIGSSSGVDFGDGQYGLQGRLTALPIWENDGRCWMHVGMSGGWRDGTSNNATSPLHTFQLRARPELRDDDPAGNPSGAPVVPNANDSRMIDTGSVVASNEWLTGFEYCHVMGPLSVQAEYGFNWLDDATGFAPTGLKLNPALPAGRTYFFSGGYAQVAYTLTGENRAYDKRLGRLNSNYFGASGPYNNAWFVRDDQGNFNFNFGAWEVAARYSYVNLNDGSGLSTIQGGVMNGFTAGLNWYLNANAKLQFDYVLNQRSALADGTIPGQTTGFGMRMQFNY